MGYGVYIREHLLGRVLITPKNLQELTEFIWLLSTAESQDATNPKFHISIRFLDHEELSGENPNLIYELSQDQFAQIDDFDIEYLNFRKAERIHVNINAGDLSTDAGILQENIIVIQGDDNEWVTQNFHMLEKQLETWKLSSGLLSIFDKLMWLPIIAIAPVYGVLVASDMQQINIGTTIPYEYLIVGLLAAYLAVAVRINNSEKLRMIYRGVWIDAGTASLDPLKVNDGYRVLAMDLIIFVLLLLIETMPFWL